MTFELLGDLSGEMSPQQEVKEAACPQQLTIISVIRKFSTQSEALI